MIIALLVLLGVATVVLADFLAKRANGERLSWPTRVLAFVYWPVTLIATVMVLGEEVWTHIAE